MEPAPFSDTPRRPVVTHLRVGRLVLVLFLVGGLVAASVIWLLRPTAKPVVTAPEETTPWPSWMRTPPVYDPPAARQPVPPPPPPSDPTRSGVPTGPGIPPLPPRGEGLRPPPTEPEPPPPYPSPPRPAPPPQPRDKPVVRKWLFAEMGTPKRKPFQADTAPGGEGQPHAQKSASLIQQARWEEPADPTYVLYPSQVIPVQLLHNLSSDLPGEIRMLVMQDIQDKFFQGTILIPQYSYIIGHQEGTPSYGQPVINMDVRSAEFPSGRMIDFTSAVVSDSQGQAGLRGKTDYHYVQLGIAAVLSAVMSAGSQAVVQNRGTYRPTWEEEVASDISRDLNESGQAVVARELKRPPTVRVPHGKLHTLQLRHAVSLQTNPVIVYK